MTALDGTNLTIDEALRLGAQEHPAIEVDARARDRVAASHALATELAGRRAVYGRTTGVGANRDTSVAQDVATDLRLLHSHATGSGELLDDRTVRTALIIRLNQLLRGGSGIHPDVIAALHAAIAENRMPRVHATGAIGTGDLSALAEIALALLGDESHGSPAWDIHPGDALPFLSSNAMTLAMACIQIERLRRWQRSQASVAALSFLAVRASRECLQPEVQAARGQAGQEDAAGAVRALLADVPVTPLRVQDSYGFRAYPQVAGALAAAGDALERVVGAELVAAAENPLIDAASGDAFHNGNFHGLPVALATDHAGLALASTGQLSVARLTELSNPEMTGLGSFLGTGAPGASGVMLLEYNQAAAQAELRHSAQPASLGSVVISRGVENHSSFSTQAVGNLRRGLDAAFDVLACELLAALRAVELHGDRLDPQRPLGAFVAALVPLLGHDHADRSLSEDLAAARGYLDSPA
ncbi:aromatic amino acid ammonia-lyase [Microbacterium mangrovi]|nr:aromatic amino acid ammonia-lyase [Microbacterium mangrovi]